MNRTILIAILASVCSTGAFAQASQAGPKGSMGSPNAQGVQIQGNTEIKAAQDGVDVNVKGTNNVGTNTAGAIKGGTQIQGNTKIKAAQKNASVSVDGKNNKGANEAGVIGGK